MNYTLITGASSGIGLELAKVFAQQGHHLILVARSTDKLHNLSAELKSKYPIEVEVFHADLTIVGASHRLFQEIQSRGLAVANLINNAGVGDHGAFSDAELTRQTEMIQVNILALTELTKLFLPAMLAQRSGRILNVASTAAFQPGPLMSVYYASKAYVLFFSEGLAEELKGTGVSVTALCPGPTISGFQAAANLKDIALMTALKIPSSKQVALYGYQALMNNKIVAVHGTANKILASIVGLMPRAWVRQLVMKLQRKRQ